MRSLILQTATRYLVPLLLLFSIYVLLRGHNEPGGGFVGGLVAAAAFSLYLIAFDVAQVRRALHFEPRHFIGGGLLIAVSSAALSLLQGKPFMTSIWDDTTLPAIGKLSTPLFFDLGVYLVVVGVVMLIVFTLAEE